MRDLYEGANNLIKKAEKVLVIAHRKPDADTLGAAVCLKICLRKRGKAVELACVDQPSKTFSFLPCIDEFVSDFEINSFDLIIIVDAGASYMTNFHLKYKDLFKSNVPILNIDHHASNDNFGEVNIVDSTAASTTVILYRFLSYLNIEIDEDMALCLLAGIYGDTGSFMHSNTSEEVYEIAADLMSKGAKIEKVSNSLFNTKPVSTLKLWGKVLERVYVNEDNVAMAVLKDKDYVSMGGGPEQLSGVIDYLNMIPGTKFAVLLNEDCRGNVKGSFRTRKSDVDLSRVAAVFGGGGHPKASGFSIPGRLSEEVHYKVISDNDKKSLEF